MNNGSYGTDAYVCAKIDSAFPNVPIVCYAMNSKDASLKRLYPCTINTNGNITISIGDNINQTNNTILCHALYVL